MAKIEIGHDVRAWTMYEVKGISRAEIDALPEDGDELRAKLREWDAAGLLTEVSTNYDDADDPFAEYANTARIDIDDSYDEEEITA